MARPLRIEFPGAVYPVTVRGNERRPVFWDDEDRRTVLSTLGRAVARWGMIAHTCCLISNHYHLLIETPDANLSRGMRQRRPERSDLAVHPPNYCEDRAMRDEAIYWAHGEGRPLHAAGDRGPNRPAICGRKLYRPSRGTRAKRRGELSQDTNT